MPIRIIPEFLRPLRTENSLDRLSKTVSTLKADIGVLIESDGERLSLVDEGGRIIEGTPCLLP